MSTQFSSARFVIFIDEIMVHQEDFKMKRQLIVGVMGGEDASADDIEAAYRLGRLIAELFLQPTTVKTCFFLQKHRRTSF